MERGKHRKKSTGGHRGKHIQSHTERNSDRGTETERLGVGDRGDKGEGEQDRQRENVREMQTEER